MPLTGPPAVALAFVLDRAAAEPPASLHPVAWFGRLVAPVDRAWPAPRLAGLVAALALPLFAGGVAVGLVRGAGALHPVAAAAAAGLVLFVTTSLRMLLGEVRAVVDATETDPDAARDRLRSLAGRDASDLSPAQVRSAAVESAAENLADGVVAPLLAFALLAPASLALGAGAAAWVKAVNTLDSMLGYRSKPVGWASARLDDLVMWLPARVAAALVAVAAADPDALLNARRWAGAPPSPNSGWPMGALASALQVRLEKPGVYELNPMGTLPTIDEARRGATVVSRAGVLAYALAGVVAWL
ncbi:cobalamin biosynthesis protein CobD [Halostella sp. JP-L12]|uniref:adenosylcobinamide-phosphate synthase CbiB n=1 Tax=Halostella TaxID=1843185 RepID=UPI000EF811A1|nr:MULTISPECIES: adenosylcobinamide-phosphate synthase CbiB [Halostella]NHN47951.1 cobalamin biosynthesis protein CobD [Halostella sp. JP-L12]